MVNTRLTQKIWPHKVRYTSHILVQKRGWHVGKTQKYTSKTVNKKRTEPTLITALLHGIYLWHKGHLLLHPTNIPTQVEEVFNKQNNIGCLQALTWLLAQEWAETHNAYLKYLGAKVTGWIWVSSLIRKLWDIAWDIWNYRNHTLKTSDLPTKATLLTHANTRISYHFNRGTIRLATTCHFLFKTKENNLLYIPIR